MWADPKLSIRRDDVRGDEVREPESLGGMPIRDRRTLSGAGAACAAAMVRDVGAIRGRSE